MVVSTAGTAVPLNRNTRIYDFHRPDW